jgi:hypothetical protein
MKILYIECKMGAAGDMLMGALYELLSEDQKITFLTTMKELFPDVVRVSAEPESRCGVCGTHMHVYINGEEEHAGHTHTHAHGNDTPHEHTHSHGNEAPHKHAHSQGNDASHEHHSYISILAKINQLDLPVEIASAAASVYRLIGEAEAKVHGTIIEQIHFHEVGSLDALADVVGCCLLFHTIGADVIYASPINVGNGTVRCAHGILPVPAPATAELLKGIPFYTGTIQSELCTPTGAAILRHFVRQFTDVPPMLTEKIGIGLGTKEFEVANCVRVFYGSPMESRDSSRIPFEDAKNRTDEADADSICDLSCNLDDMTGEDLGYCMELLFAEGALDVFYQPIQMKKNRPGILLHCFCQPADREKFIRLILIHTTTRGVRHQEISRVTLAAHTEEINTPYGTVRQKISTGAGITKSKPEFEDIKKLAKENNLPLAKIKESC